MPNPINLSIRFRLTKDRKPTRLSIKADGTFVFVDEMGREVTPEKMERTVHYHRRKGPKVQSRTQLVGDVVTIGGLHELTKHQSLFLIDTNTKVVRGQKTSAACFICCRFLRESGKVRIVCDGKLNIYEFRGIPDDENPEMLAILKVARDLAKSPGGQRVENVAFISDSELGSHDAINQRQVPIYKGHYLPQGFVLYYASPETGHEVINRLMRFCEKESSTYLKCLDDGAVKTSELTALEEDPRIHYRYMFRNGLEIINPVVDEAISIQPGTVVSLYGVKNPHRK